jgi:hypothetical protein
MAGCIVWLTSAGAVRFRNGPANSKVGSVTVSVTMCSLFITVSVVRDFCFFLNHNSAVRKNPNYWRLVSATMITITSKVDFHHGLSGIVELCLYD